MVSGPRQFLRRAGTEEVDLARKRRIFFSRRGRQDPGISTLQGWIQEKRSFKEDRTARGPIMCQAVFSMLTGGMYIREMIELSYRYSDLSPAFS